MLDASWIFSEAQAITALGTTFSTNTVRLPTGYDPFGSAVKVDPNVGGGPKMWVNVSVDTAFTSADTTATLAVALYGGTTSTTASMTMIEVLGPIKNTTSNLLAGQTICSFPLPAKALRDYNFLALAYVVANTVFSAGKVEGYISMESRVAK